MTVAAVVILIATFSASAQSRGHKLTMSLVDASTGKGVEFATVSLTPKGSDKVYKYVLSTATGDVTFADVAKGDYVLKAELLGYKLLTKDVTVSGNASLGKIEMAVDAQMIEEAVITDVGNPIVVKQDTIEHNVALMNVSDNDVLEDLLKLLPGVEVEDGKIMANGKQIKKITVDGKTFFLDDPKLTSKNLPAKLVEKVKIIEKKSEQAEFTGIDDGEEETVIDLTIHKGMNNGWFGNLMAGGGRDFQKATESDYEVENKGRYQGAAMVARFSNASQLAFIGNINNTNNRGFEDFSGNMMADLRTNTGRVSGSGITTSYMTGLTGGKVFDNKSEVTANYIFSGSENVVDDESFKTTFKSDGSDLLAWNKGDDRTTTYGHKVGARADWKVSKATSILFEPQFNIGYGDFDENTRFTTDRAYQKDTVKVNDGYSRSTGENHNMSTSGRILWRQRIVKPGRTMSINATYSFSNNGVVGYNDSETDTYKNGNIGSVKRVDQMYERASQTIKFGGRISYIEPLGANFYVEATYSYNYSQSKSHKNTYGKDDNGAYTVLDPLYSNEIESKSITQRAGINFLKQEQKYKATLGVNAQPARTINNTEGANERHIDRKVVNWAPNARFDYNFTKNKVLRFRYNGKTTQPSINQLQPVPNNSNPQRITLGNPNLDPSFSHDLNFSYRSSNRQTFSSINTSLDFVYNSRNIVNASFYDAGGVQYTIPLNNDKGTYSTTARVTYNTPIAKSKFSVTLTANGTYKTGVSYVGKDDINVDDPTSYLNLLNYDENSYQNVSASGQLRFTYRDKIMEYSLGGNARYSQAWYTVASKNKAATWTNRVTARAVAKIPNVFDLSTDAQYVFYAGYTQGYNDPSLVWNAQISKLLFKNNFTLAVKAYDILNQSKNTNRTMNDNYVRDMRTNTLGRYVIASLTYRFGTFGKRGRNGGGRMNGFGGGGGYGGYGRR